MVIQNTDGLVLSELVEKLNVLPFSTQPFLRVHHGTMPIMHGQRRLSQRLRQNWAAMHPDESPVPGDVIDDSLTNLGWLQNLNVVKFSTAPAAVSASRANFSPAPIAQMTSSSAGVTTVNSPTFKVYNRQTSAPVSLSQQVPSLNQHCYQQLQHQIQQQQQQQQQLLLQQQDQKQCPGLQVNPNMILNMSTLRPIKLEPATSPPASVLQPIRISVRSSSLSNRTSPVNTVNCSRGQTEIQMPYCGTQTYADQNIASLADCNDLALGMADVGVASRYKLNPAIKPHYSYATLICMALHGSAQRMMTLTGIFNWITENFPYYSSADPSWQNSIRNSLSLNKCFQKVSRSVKQEQIMSCKIQQARRDKSSECYWMINPEFQNLVDRNIFKKRRSADDISMAIPAAKKFRGNSLDDLAPPQRSTASLASCRNFSLPSMASMSGRQDESDIVGHVSDSILHFGADSLTDALDMSWSANVLNQDLVDVGICVKIDRSDDLQDLTTALDSPPPSDSDSSDLSLEEFLRVSTMLGDDTQDCDDALDLTVHGTALRPPDWWADTANFPLPLSPSGAGGLDLRSGLHTPTHTSPSYEHPWAEMRSNFSDSISLLDSDDLLDVDFKPFL